MGINCTCPVDKITKNNEIVVDSEKNPYFIIKNPTRETDKSTNSQILPIIKIQSCFRAFITRRKASRSIKYSSTGDTKESMLIIEKTSIKKELIKSLYNIYPPLEDGVLLSQINIFFTGFGEYSGEWNDSIKERHGRGIMKFSDDTTYIGYWKNDKANGKGKLMHAKGDYYEGDFVDDRIEGFGTYTNINGSIYIGNWKNDLQDGYGKEIWADHLEYEGDYKEGKRWGKGKLQLVDGSVYEGDFYSHQIHGKGKFKIKGQGQYIGNWKYNKMSGEGEFIFIDGKTYKGQYLNDLKDGFGVFTWPSGKIYSGKWKNGKRHGEGKMFSPLNKQWRDGIWNEGKLVKWKE